eukprot:6017474-Ditylum_brightwellii.AAC.1
MGNSRNTPKQQAKGECIMVHPTQVEVNPSTFLEYISTLPEHVQRFMGNLQQQEIDLNYWQEALCCGDAHIKLRKEGIMQ